MKIGDVSRRRRLADPARLRWYAYHRAVRFSRRMLQPEGKASPCLTSLTRQAHSPFLAP